MRNAAATPGVELGPSEVEKGSLVARGLSGIARFAAVGCCLRRGA